MKIEMGESLFYFWLRHVKECQLVQTNWKVSPKWTLRHEEELNDLFSREGYGFKVRLIANEEFESSVLKPILLISDGISDTSELFIRSYQMFKMFDNEAAAPKGLAASAENVERSNEGHPGEEQEDSVYRELKVGKLARLMQDAAYSKRAFDLQYPLLTRADGEYEKVRYYAKPLNIREVKYVLCSQWFEKESDNDGPYLLRWIKRHQE